MSTDSSPAEQSNETRFFNQTINQILEFLKNISVCGAIISTIAQYVANKSASSFYGINSELFHSQPFWSIIIDFFAPALVNLAIMFFPFMMASYYRNSLKSIKEDSNSKGKTHALLNIHIPLVLLIICYTLLSSGYILWQYANLFDSLKKRCAFIIICIVILLILSLVLFKMYIEYQARKEENWRLEKKFSKYGLYGFILYTLILYCYLIYNMEINILLLLILCNLFIIYFFATLYSFLDENKFFLITCMVCTVLCYIPFIYTIALPLSSEKSYYSGKKQYEIVEPISSSNIASGSNLKVVILHKDNQLLLMDFTTGGNTEDGSATSKENETQAKQSIEEILSKASESNLNIKKWEYTIQDENLYKFYTVTFKDVKCE